MSEWVKELMIHGSPLKVGFMAQIHLLFFLPFTHRLVSTRRSLEQQL